jgi:hypothetical protein
LLLERRAAGAAEVATASSSSLNRVTVTTGPKISSVGPTWTAGSVPRPTFSFAWREGDYCWRLNSVALVSLKMPTIAH